MTFWDYISGYFLLKEENPFSYREVPLRGAYNETEYTLYNSWKWGVVTTIYGPAVILLFQYVYKFAIWDMPQDSASMAVMNMLKVRLTISCCIVVALIICKCCVVCMRAFYRRRDMLRFPDRYRSLDAQCNDGEGE